MPRLPAQLAVLLFLASPLFAQSPLTFMGRKVTITTPGTDPDGFFPKGPASVCIEGAPRQCYTMPGDFGRNTSATVVNLAKDDPALLFSADGGGVSGAVTWTILTIKRDYQ